MTLQQLTYISTVAKYGSFSKAAQSLYVSQPGISRMVQALEEELGITIFVRSSAGISLTDQGRELLNMGNRLLQDADRIKEHFIETESDTSDTLSVSAQHYSFAIDAMMMVQKRSDKKAYTFKTYIEQGPHVVRHVVEKESELGFIFITTENKRHMNRVFDDNDLEFHCLIESKPYVFVHNSHPLADKKIVTFDDLKPYPCIMYELDADAPSILNEELVTTNGFFPNKVNVVNGLYQSLSIMIENQGFDMGTGVLSRSNRKYGVVRIPVKDYDMPVEIGYICRKGHKLSPLAEEYIRCVNELWNEAKIIDSESNNTLNV